MKRKHFLSIAAAAVLLFLVLFSLQRNGMLRGTGADIGDFAGDSDYDFSSDGSDSYSDWGGGSDDWSGGSDWGSDSYDNYGYSGYGGGYHSYSDSSYDDDSSVAASAVETVLIWVFVIALIIIIIMVRRYLNNKNSKGYRPPHSRTPVRAAKGNAFKYPEDLKPIGEYKTLDPSFDEDELVQHLSNWYVQMQNAWTDKKIDGLRPMFTDSLFAQLERGVQAHVRKHETNYVDKISVMNVKLNGYRQANGEDEIWATLQTRITDYTLNDDTGELVSGDEKREKFMTYVWTLTRTSGQTSDQEEAMTTISCPHCGAPVNINESAKCPYCGSVLTVKEHGFVVSRMQAIRQETR